jgi:Cu+-exporting ATPase
MIRRQFIKLATLAGATGLVSLGTVEALDSRAAKNSLDSGKTKVVKWRVRGFTCVTCAVGLETMLRRQKGVTEATATWPEAAVTIRYNAGEVDQEKLRSFITELGFTAVPTDDPKG